MSFKPHSSFPCRDGRPRPSFILGVLTAVFLSTLCGQAQQPPYDFIISGARIIDGTGAAWHYGDIAIRGDRIAAMDDLEKASANHRIDAHGLVVSPGFIDVQGQSEFNILVDGRAASKITQGVTTEITGEGSSIAPLNDRLVDELRPEAEKYHVDLDWRKYVSAGGVGSHSAACF